MYISDWMARRAQLSPDKAAIIDELVSLPLSASGKILKRVIRESVQHSES